MIKTYSLSEYAETIRSLQEGSLSIIQPPPHLKEHTILNILLSTFENPHNVLRRVLHIQDNNISVHCLATNDTPPGMTHDKKNGNTRHPTTWDDPCPKNRNTSQKASEILE